MSDIYLVEPPVSNPFQVQAFLPELTAYIRRENYSCVPLDASILFFDGILRESALKCTVDNLKQRGMDISKAQEDLVERIDGSVQTTRNPNSLNDPLKLLNAYSDLYDAAKLWFLQHKQIESDELTLRNLIMCYDRTNPDSISTAIIDEERNPFIGYFNSLLEQTVAKEKPRISGISITFQDQIIPALTLAKRIRELSPETKIVLGGQMVTRCYEVFVNHKGLHELYDYLVGYEGELPLVGILRKELEGAYSEIPNVRINDNGRIRELGEWGEHIPSIDLGDIPTPDYRGLPLDLYYTPHPQVFITASRSCYNDCNFCAIKSGHNRPYRTRSAENITLDFEEITDVVLQITGKKPYFKFTDDTMPPTVLKQLASIIKSRKLNVRYEGFLRLDDIFDDPQLMRNLKESGLVMAEWGFESPHQEQLDKMNKRTKASKYDKILSHAANAGILNFVFSIIGYPGETNEQLEDNTNYIVANKDIHTLTLSTFELPKHSPYHRNQMLREAAGIELLPPPYEGFFVRLPFLLNDKNTKPISERNADEMQKTINNARLDIWLQNMFPNQVRAQLVYEHGNNWPWRLVEEIGEEVIKNWLEGKKTEVTRRLESRGPEDIQKTLEALKAMERSYRIRSRYDEKRHKRL